MAHSTAVTARSVTFELVHLRPALIITRSRAGSSLAVGARRTVLTTLAGAEPPPVAFILNAPSCILESNPCPPFGFLALVRVGKLWRLLFWVFFFVPLIGVVAVILLVVRIVTIPGVLLVVHGSLPCIVDLPETLAPTLAWVVPLAATGLESPALPRSLGEVVVSTGSGVRCLGNGSLMLQERVAGFDDSLEGVGSGCQGNHGVPNFGAHIHPLEVNIPNDGVRQQDVMAPGPRQQGTEARSPKHQVFSRIPLACIQELFQSSACLVERVDLKYTLEVRHQHGHTVGDLQVSHI